MSPGERAKQLEAREKLARERSAAEEKRLNQPLSELTFGDLINAIEEALNRKTSSRLCSRLSRNNCWPII
jgi:hypothetical protein